jgi:hypothetical protein
MKNYYDEISEGYEELHREEQIKKIELTNEERRRPTKKKERKDDDDRRRNERNEQNGKKDYKEPISRVSGATAQF